MNVTDIISMGTQFGNNTLNGIKGTSTIISTNTGISQYMILILMVVLFILIAKDKASTAIVFIIIAALIFMVIGGLGVLV